MAATSVVRRSSYLRSIWKTTNLSSSSPARPNLMVQQTRISRHSNPARLRRESLFLSSLLPFHSATASACLISKLPSEASTSTEGRFANYLSPI